MSDGFIAGFPRECDAGRGDTASTGCRGWIAGLQIPRLKTPHRPAEHIAGSSNLFYSPVVGLVHLQFTGRSKSPIAR